MRRSGRGEEALRKRDIRLTRIAIAIVGVFIACHLPRFIPNIVEMVTSMPQVKNMIHHRILIHNSEKTNASINSHDVHFDFESR